MDEDQIFMFRDRAERENFSYICLAGGCVRHRSYDYCCYHCPHMTECADSCGYQADEDDPSGPEYCEQAFMLHHKVPVPAPESFKRRLKATVKKAPSGGLFGE